MTGRNAPRLAPASTAITSHSVPVVLATYCSHSHIAASIDRWQAAIADGLRAMHANGHLVPEADRAALQGGVAQILPVSHILPVNSAQGTLRALADGRAAAHAQAHGARGARRTGFTLVT